MIPYVEVIGKYNLKSFAIVEPSECWFELSFFDIGEFEVYASATQDNINALKMGNYIKIPNRPYLWIIKSVNYTFNSEGARMIDVKGFEAKWLLHTRIILAPYQLESDLSLAVYNLVIKNLGIRALAPRIIQGFNVIQPSYSIAIDDTQATRQDLSEFTLALLKANKCGSYTTFENGITWRSIQGVDRSEAILFSQSMDNLITSEYYQNSENKKTYCRVVSKFSQNNQDVEYVQDYNSNNSLTGIDRLEMVVESNLSTKMEDGTEISPSSSTYATMQQEEGKNKLAEHYVEVQFNAEIDLKHSNYEFEKDFFIGDLVKVRDEFFNYEEDVRILKYTFKQDASGYGEEAEYGIE